LKDAKKNETKINRGMTDMEEEKIIRNRDNGDNARGKQGR
jgi:hypothetical protein